MRPEDPLDSISRISEKDFRDYEFIAKDFQDFAALSQRDQLNRLVADPWSAFSGLRGSRGYDLRLSREAQKRFTQIAARGLKELGTAAHIHRLERVVQALKCELSTLILNGLDLTAETAHEIFNSAIRKLDKEYSELTYYVPCSVVAEQSYASFTIGPLKFVLRDQFLKQNESTIHQAIPNFGGPQAHEKLFDRTLSFYSNFRWIASISVPRCDPEISRRRAHGGIQKALDTFKFLVGGERASLVRQGYDLTAPSDYAELVSSSPGSFSLRFGGKLHDAITNDHWYEQVSADPAWPLLQSVLSNFWKNWRDLDEIQTRFLDALSWHSDAISEPDYGAKIVKFWTSIERLLSISPGGNITARAAVLASNGVEEYGTYSRELDFLYQRRSAIVHGGANRATESWYVQAAVRSEEASRTALFQYLYAIPGIRAYREPTDRKRLGAWLKYLDTIAKQFRSQLRG